MSRNGRQTRRITEPNARPGAPGDSLNVKVKFCTSSVKNAAIDDTAHARSNALQTRAYLRAVTTDLLASTLRYSELQAARCC